MSKIPVVAIFDIGKTNKKLLLFDEQYQLLFEENKQFEEIRDEDGFPCEDIRTLTAWLIDSFNSIKKDPRFEIKGLNFSGYGASFVFLDKNGRQFLPLYNYLKPYPLFLREQFYRQYGGEKSFARSTASPVLGNLNSGMQLYRMKYEKPTEFAEIGLALHLPQYLSHVFSGVPLSDITSIGCHTNLWHFETNDYHPWVQEQAVLPKLAPVAACDSIAAFIDAALPVGVGLHDSSAALIPYLASFRQPFILLSTGTWCISLNPFNKQVLTDQELDQDCLSYLTYLGNPVKASRLFAGNEHEIQVKRISSHFNKASDYYTRVRFDPSLVDPKISVSAARQRSMAMQSQSVFESRLIGTFTSYEAAYHQLISDLIAQQIQSTGLVLEGSPVKKIYVDGGFSKNGIYMQLLANSFPDLGVYAATVAQASALGAAMAIHRHWNPQSLPGNLVAVEQYPPRLT